LGGIENNILPTVGQKRRKMIYDKNYNEQNVMKCIEYTNFNSINYKYIIFILYFLIHIRLMTYDEKKIVYQFLFKGNFHNYE